MKGAKVLGIIVIFLAAIYFSVCAHADGMIIPDDIRYIPSEPEQEAVILWDGEKETMILSTKIESADTINMAWIIPTQSSTIPEVSGSDARIFQKFRDFFYEKADVRVMDALAGTLSAESHGVTVIETKEINVYDLVTLQASNAQDLIDWLNDNGYSATDEMVDVLEEYVGTRYYFIANKVDLGNWHKTAMRLIEEHDSTVDAACSYDYDSTYGSHIRRWNLNNEEEKALQNLCEHVRSLKYGSFETPIKIEFTPEKPQYPLKPSRENPGYTTITVYVASPEPMVDSNDILKLDRSKKVTQEFKNDLLGIVDIGNVAYVTRMTYSGELKYLNQDATFRVDYSLIEIDYGFILLVIGAVIIFFLVIGYFKM